MSSSRSTLKGRPTVHIPTVHISETTQFEMEGPFLHFIRSAFRRVLSWVGVFALVATVSCGDPAGPIPVASIVVTPGQTTLKSLGETAALGAVARDASGNVIEGRAFTWTTTSAAVASIDGGAVATAVADGQVTITATSEGVSGSATLVVNQTVASVEITPATKQLVSINETVELAATAKDARGNVMANKAATWSTSAPTAVRVISATGVATAQANGAATITATVDDKSATAELTVAQAPAQLAFVGKPATMQNGVTIPSVNVEVRDALGTLVATATPPVTLAIETNPASGVLAGTTQVAAVAGIAKFTTLAIDKAAVGYRLSASATGLTAGTSPAFEIMNVPARIDSVRFATTNVKRASSVQYSVWITNGAGRNLTPTVIQGYILQGTILNGAGGVAPSVCGGGSGVIAPGVCKLDWALHTAGNNYALGAATARIELVEGPNTRGVFTAQVTIVP